MYIYWGNMTTFNLKKNPQIPIILIEKHLGFKEAMWSEN